MALDGFTTGDFRGEKETLLVDTATKFLVIFTNEIDHMGFDRCSEQNVGIQARQTRIQYMNRR
jgi:hypothetical protein